MAQDSRQNYSRQLAKTVDVREDALQALNWEDDRLTERFNATKNGKYWLNLVAEPADIVCMGAIALTFTGVIGIGAGLALYVGGAFIRFAAKRKDLRDAVQYEIEHSVRTELVEKNQDVIIGEQAVDTDAVERLAQNMKVSPESIIASEIEPARLTDMFNSAVSASKWRAFGAYGGTGFGLSYLGLMLMSGFSSPLVVPLAVASVGGFAVSGINYHLHYKVRKELQDVASDKLIELVNRQQGPVI